jgi:hypothetical protein
MAGGKKERLLYKSRKEERNKKNARIVASW